MDDNETRGRVVDRLQRLVDAKGEGDRCSAHSGVPDDRDAPCVLPSGHEGAHLWPFYSPGNE